MLVSKLVPIFLHIGSINYGMWLLINYLFDFERISFCYFPFYRGEQKRILTAFKGIKHKRVEKERVEREQEELLTRRFTTSIDVEQSKVKFNEANFVIDLDADGVTGDKTHKKKLPNSKTVVLPNKLRNPKPLVKRVRTRYLDFSTDFFGMTRAFSCVDWILLFGLSLVILMAVFCFIVWQTTPRQFE